VFIILADHKEQGESLLGESSSDTSLCSKLHQQFGAVYGNDKSFLAKKKIKKIQNGDLRSDHISHQQKWIHTDLGLHAANLNSNTTAFIA